MGVPGIFKVVSRYDSVRSESNMLKSSPKMLSGISQNVHQFCSSVFPSCLQYAPRSATFQSISISECFIRVFHYKVIVLLESINLSNLLLFAVSID